MPIIVTVYTPIFCGLVHDTTSVSSLKLINDVLCILSAAIVAVYFISDAVQYYSLNNENGETVMLLASLNNNTL